MTCIVAIVKDGVVWMGSDRRVEQGNLKFGLHNNLSKICKISVGDAPEFLVAVTGKIRSMNIVQTIDSSNMELTQDPHYNVVRVLLAHIRSDMIDHGALPEADDKTDGSPQILIGHRGHLYNIGYGFGLSEIAGGCYAIGSGEEVAMGSMHTSHALGVDDPVRVITLALEAASDIAVGVARPFDIMSI